MPASTSIRSGGIRDVWKGQPTSVGQLGAATLVADLSRSVRAITDAYKMTALLGGSSPLMAFKREPLPLMDLSKSYANAKGFAFAGALTEKTNGVKGLVEAKGILHDVMATRRIAVGLVDAFPTSSFVAQLPRRPLPLSSRTFYGSPLQVVAIDRLPLREIALLRTSIQMPSLQPLSSAFSLLREWERSQLFFEAVAAVASEWEGRALWFVLSSLPMGRLRSLAGHDREQVEEAVLRALEAVVAEGEFVPALREVLEQAPISDFQRANLIHGLELVERREHVLAVLPLLGGLQGAIYRVARERSVIDAKRRLLSNPGKRAHGSTPLYARCSCLTRGSASSSITSSTPRATPTVTATPKAASAAERCSPSSPCAAGWTPSWGSRHETFSWICWVTSCHTSSSTWTSRRST